MEGARSLPICEKLNQIVYIHVQQEVFNQRIYGDTLLCIRGLIWSPAGPTGSHKYGFTLEPSCIVHTLISIVYITTSTSNNKTEQMLRTQRNSIDHIL